MRTGHRTLLAKLLALAVAMFYLRFLFCRRFMISFVRLPVSAVEQMANMKL